MTPQETKCLRALRAVGPASAKEVGDAMGVHFDTAHRLLWQLRQRNIVARYGRAKYDVTKLGRGVLDRSVTPPLLPGM